MWVSSPGRCGFYPEMAKISNGKDLEEKSIKTVPFLYQVLKKTRTRRMTAKAYRAF